MTANRAEKPDGKLLENLVLPYGEWQGHPTGGQSYGPAEGRAMIEYFDATAKAAGRPVVIDYEHQTLSGGEAPAAGWIWELFEDLEADPPGIYMRNEWTARASERIKAGEYKYISPVIAPDYVDPVSGNRVPWVLYNAALTNVPFMSDKMKAVAASSSIGQVYINSHPLKNANIHAHTLIENTMDPKALLDKVLAALGLPADAPGEQAVELLEKIVEFVGMMPGPTGEPTPPTPEGMAEAMPAMKAVLTNSKQLAEVAALLKCDAADVLANVAALRADKTEDRYVSRTEFEALASELAARKADELLTANAAKIPPVDRDFWRTRAIANHDDTAALLARMPDVLPASAPVTVPNTNDPALDDFTIHVRRALGTSHLHNKEA